MRLTGGEAIKSLENHSSREGNCKKECEETSECVGITRQYMGNKRCVLYSGDVNTKMSPIKNSHTLRRL
jgi:hypothetical protein